MIRTRFVLATALIVPAAFGAGVPTIASFSASPAMITSGQLSTLSWIVSGATSLSIDQGVGTVFGTLARVRPMATTTYMLTATNGAGSVTATTTITVGAAPVIAWFIANPIQVRAGQSTTLSWSVSGASAVRVGPLVGAVTGTTVSVIPRTNTVYTLTATNIFGSRTASVTVMVGSAPIITRFTANPTKIAPGGSTTLTWNVGGVPTLSIAPAIGAVTGTSLRVSPGSTTTYTLTAVNNFGSSTATVTINVGTQPSVASFTANPTAVGSGQSSTLSWTITGSPPTVFIGPGVGYVTGTSVTVSPTVSTTYTLTAANVFGTTSASATVGAGSPPTINSFFTNANLPAGPGVPATLNWSTTGATTVNIDHGVGAVTGTSVRVAPSSPTTYTLTATNAVGSVTATATVNYVPLAKVNNQLFYSEHALFLIPNANQVAWIGANSWGSVFSSANIASYVATLKSLFPDDFFFVVVIANNLNPNSVPNVLTYRHLADGIGMTTVTGVGVPNICRYNIGGGTVTSSSLGVLDHEIGHNWGVFIGSEVGSGHWLSNSTVTGQMATVYSDDGYINVKQISGDPTNGFTWTAVDNLTKNETETFDLHDLYLMGLNPTFPDVYVLNSPVYNPDNSMSYSSVDTYDQAWVEQQNGVRNPDYKTSDKKLRMGVIYVARNVAEILSVYQPIESAVNQFVNAEQIDTTKYRFQVPFLVDTQYRASVDALLADLDGNRTPTLSLDVAPYLTSSDGTASVPFTAADPGGSAPVVSCVPTSPNCAVNGSSVDLTGLSTGTYFFTIKAEDAAGKKAFAHFVVDVS